MHIGVEVVQLLVDGVSLGVEPRNLRPVDLDVLEREVAKVLQGSRVSAKRGATAACTGRPRVPERPQASLPPLSQLTPIVPIAEPAACLRMRCVRANRCAVLASPRHAAKGRAARQSAAEPSERAQCGLQLQSAPSPSSRGRSTLCARQCQCRAHGTALGRSACRANSTHLQAGRHARRNDIETVHGLHQVAPARGRHVVAAPSGATSSFAERAAAPLLWLPFPGASPLLQLAPLWRACTGKDLTRGAASSNSKLTGTPAAAWWPVHRRSPAAAAAGRRRPEPPRCQAPQAARGAWSA